ncbi:MAG: MerR family transcriptional regulator, partial [Defluviitaleaceae bacterium]|nr:MerR family transcriptional regulator [Defluviitaleaceae bacterium]
MLMKIGDAAAKYGISHRSLHYWESAGILKSSRAGNDYRYYDEENLRRIKQIVLLRKLRLSIPSIQEIFTSDELSNVIAIFAEHLDGTKKETEQLNALGTVLRRLLNMLKDRQSIESVYTYLDTNHSAESDDLKKALQTVLAEPAREIEVEPPPEPVVDMSGVDLALEEMTEADVQEVAEVIKRCYPGTKEMDKLLFYFDLAQVSALPDCRYFYKIIQNSACIGAVQLAYVGMEATLIRSLACPDPDINIYLFELLKQKHPDTLCWMIRNAPDGGKFRGKEDFNYDWEGQKQRFWEDNGFVFYTDARYNQFIKMLKPHDEVYNSSRYRYALQD